MIVWKNCVGLYTQTITRKLISRCIFKCLNFYIKHFAKMSVKFWRTNNYVNFMNLGNLRMPSYFKSYAGIRSIWNTSDIWNFEIATEEQIQLTKSTTSCTSNTDECIFHITWVQSCNTGAACCQNYVCLDFLWCFFNIMFSKTTNCTGP